MSDDTRPDAVREFVDALRHKRAFSVYGEGTAYDDITACINTINSLAAELERVRTEHAELRRHAAGLVHPDMDDDAFNVALPLLRAWLAAHPQDPKEAS